MECFCTFTLYVLNPDSYLSIRIEIQIRIRLLLYKSGSTSLPESRTDPPTDRSWRRRRSRCRRGPAPCPVVRDGSKLNHSQLFTFFVIYLFSRNLWKPQVPGLWHTFVIIFTRIKFLKIVTKTKTGASVTPERKLWLRSGLNKAKAFVQAE